MIGDFEEMNRIRELLSEHPRGMSITDISRELKIHRTTVARYLDSLQMKGEVDLRIVSTAKIYHLSTRIPSSAIAVYTHEPYLIITYRLVVGSEGNGFEEYFNLSDPPKGRQINDPILDSLIPDEMIGQIKQAIQGQKGMMELTVSTREISKRVSVSIIPTVCEDGRPGCVLIYQDKTKYLEAINQFMRRFY